MVVERAVPSLPRHWRVLDRAPDDLFTHFAQYPRFLVQLAYNRGATDAAALGALLDGRDGPDPDPAGLPDLAAAVDRVGRAINRGERVAVYGDFDLDGVTGAAVLVQVLRGGGLDPIPYLPHRSEGHGLNIPAIAQLADQGVTLILSADCGTTALDEAAYAMRRGVDLIVTDHHACYGRLPPALALINPSRPECDGVFAGLSGAGVAFQLARGLIRAGLTPGCAEGDLLDLVALGTVADVAPLTGLNRRYVREGLRHLASGQRAGLRALIDLIQLGPEPLTPLTIGYQIAPRFNAAGRLDHAEKGFELLTTRDPARAVELAAELDRLNRERQAQLARAQARLAELLAGEDPRLLPALVIEDPDLPEPLLGLLAGRLAQEYGRPAVVIRWEAGECRASARAPAGYDLAAALARCAGLLTRFGGHAQAAGFAVPTDRVGELRERLVGIFGEGPPPGHPELTIDLEVALRHHNWRIHAGIQRLAPFGPGNLEPVFLSRCVKVVQCRRFGPDDRHLRLKLFDDHSTWEAVAFNRGDQLPASSRIDLVYHLRDHHWNGERYLQLHVLDLAPAS
ncbi:MAG TPA: single-stranded-DNA-specific exonuclease RecJ [Dehalococcoidia bacterium]|nr:single-stranded-DNA-specific exonuclease RecJ [Dehalococcoidia bacterium]